MTIGLNNTNSNFSRTLQINHQTNSQTLSFTTSLLIFNLLSFLQYLLTHQKDNNIHLLPRGGMWCQQLWSLPSWITFFMQYLISLIFHSTLEYFPHSGVRLSSYLYPKILTPLFQNTFAYFLSSLSFLKCFRLAFIDNSLNLYISRTFSVPYNRGSNPIIAQPPLFSKWMMAFGRVKRIPRSQGWL